MRVNIITTNHTKQSYIVDNIDSALEIIKDYADENNFLCEADDTSRIQRDDPNNNDPLLGTVNLMAYESSKVLKAVAFIWSK